MSVYQYSLVAGFISFQAIEQLINIEIELHLWLPAASSLDWYKLLAPVHLDRSFLEEYNKMIAYCVCSLFGKTSGNDPCDWFSFIPEFYSMIWKCKYWDSFSQLNVKDLIQNLCNNCNNLWLARWASMMSLNSVKVYFFKVLWYHPLNDLFFNMA